MEHNISFEKQAPEFVKERNKSFSEAYRNILITIDKIQSFLEDELLRTRIESDMRFKPGVKSTISQCVNLWCIISLGCDNAGRYKMVYIIVRRIQNMIGEDMASILIRRIYQFTSGNMETFVRIGCLYQDCLEVFNQLMEDQKKETFHKLITKNQNS